MDNSQILWQAYQKYLLPLGGKKVPTPYRLNHPYQPDPKKYGKSSPEQLTKDVIEESARQSFDLEKASIREIRNFMEKNLLGIDCSGYAYHCLDFLLIQLGRGGMEKVGFPTASRTNVATLSLDKFSNPLESLSKIKPGDIITFQTGPHGHAHVLLIMEMSQGKIIYTQSSGLGKTSGVQQNTITILNPSKSLKDQFWSEELANGKKRVDFFLPELGDGVRRLKILI